MKGRKGGRDGGKAFEGKRRGREKVLSYMYKTDTPF